MSKFGADLETTIVDERGAPHHAAPQGAGMDRHAGRHEIPTPDYELDGIYQERGISLTGRDEPDPVTSRLA